MSEMAVPACKAGGVILFDFRLLHRGTPNTGGERAIALAVLSTGFAAGSAHVSEQRRLRELVEALPERSRRVAAGVGGDSGAAAQGVDGGQEQLVQVTGNASWRVCVCADII